MLDWIFKRNAPAATAPAAAPPRPAAAEPTPARPAEPAVDWPARLQQASGDDQALLALLRQRSPLDLKLAAVAALTGEAALKQAEHEFRSHDRRVHRLAKQRYQAAVARRQCGEQAARLIDAASALAGEPMFAVNRVGELERAWQALDAGAVDAAQAERFRELLARLGALAMQHAEQELQRKRTRAALQQALETLQAACADAAAGTLDRAGLAQARTAAQNCADAAEPSERPDALARAVDTATALDARLALLEGTPDDPAGTEPGPPPLADARIEALLQQRAEQARQQREQAQQDRAARRREQAGERQRARHDGRVAAAATHLEQAETALAAGQLAEARRHLLDIDAALHGEAAEETLHARIAAAQAQFAQLRGWQDWAGGRARDELVQQAETLAGATAGQIDADLPKLSIRQRAELINELRARWKELDRHGGGAPRTLWQRFDAALETAYEPVAAQAAAQRATREQNLAARQQLLDALDALPLEASDDGGAGPDPKALARALEQFHADWGKLGPLIHTVPQAARQPLLERLQAAVRRVEAPLDDARRVARAEREALVARAQALAAGCGARLHSPALSDDVRALQAEWQRHAKALPLARSDETALWTAFRAAIDSIYGARQASYDARDAELKASAAERLALIERAEALAAAPVHDLARTLAEIERAWQRCGPAPRDDAAALERRFGTALDAARRCLGDQARRDWLARCDALQAKVDLCDALEQGADDDPATLEQRWAAWPALPDAWEQALRRRAGLTDTGADGPLSIDELLLQLELALELPSPPEAEAARRELKLQALKSALEGRRGSAAAASDPASLLADLLGRGGLDEARRARRAAVLDAVRRGRPIGPR